MPAREHTYDLPHGIRLAVSDATGKLSIRDLADFLAEGIRHFKQHRDVLETGAYTLGDYYQPVHRGRKLLGEFRLTSGGGSPLTAAEWTEAVVQAFCNATTLEDMLEQLPAFRELASKEGGWLEQVVAGLESGRCFDALRALLGRKSSA